MMDRYSITKGMYGLFDHRIKVPNLQNTPVFIHEYYHHIQNVSTILGGERLNLLMQFLAHATNLASSHTPLFAPFNLWYQQGMKNKSLSPKLQKRLENLVFHQDEWMYLDKFTYPLHYFKKEECYDENVAVLPNEEKESLEPYIIREEDGLLVGYPVGGFTITESGAYALELWHAEKFDPKIFTAINEKNYQYLIVLEMLYKLIGDFRTACLATFMLCDLAMIISTPSIGFLAIYQTARYIFDHELNEEMLINWYHHTYQAFKPQIDEAIRLEIEIINDIRDKKSQLNNVIDYTIEWQLKLMEKGLELRLKNRMEFAHKLLSRQQVDFDSLIQDFPPSLIETTDDGNIIYNSEDDVNTYEMLNASYQLYLGLCRNPTYLFNRDDIIHLKNLDDKTFIFELQKDGNNTDAYGYMLHTIGLLDKKITLLNE